MSFPEGAGFGGVFVGWTEVWSALVAESLLEDLEVFAVAGGDANINVDGAVNVADRSADAAREAGARLEWGQALKR